MPIVLTTNEVVLNPDHDWKDIPGVQYHYPNGYKNKIRPGDEFIYYRGVHRPAGKRGPAEYLGRGRIGEIVLDPDSPNERLPNRFCRIEDYVPFASPVPVSVDGSYFETITQANGWRVSVREISDQTYAAIIAAAGEKVRSPTPAAAARGLVESDSLIVPRAKTVGSGGSSSGYGRSKQSKAVGDWAEGMVVDFIQASLRPQMVIHRAAQRETPGWDVEYVDADGELHRVEVKGTVAGAFTTIDLTAGELRAAQAHGGGYWLYLVAGCLSDRARIQRIRNPAARLSAGDWTASPAVYTVRLG